MGSRGDGSGRKGLFLVGPILATWYGKLGSIVTAPGLKGSIRASAPVGHGITGSLTIERSLFEGQISLWTVDVPQGYTPPSS
eukprot:scaffold175684_cov23-Tisochrysis_lutea.AAC.1